MHDHGRSRVRRRTAGFRQVRSWTRWSIGVGAVLSAVLAAGLGYVLPGHAAGNTPTPTSTHQAQHHQKKHRLTPPSSTPRQSTTPRQQATQPPVTSGGS